MTRLKILVLVAATLVAITCGKSAGKEPQVKAAPDAPDIILITIDTLRADVLGTYGYTRETSPYIDSIARAGIKFENTFSTSSWTVPSMVSLMTSRYPHDHGVVHGLVSKGRVEHQEVIPRGLPLLAERLQQAGYSTFGVSSNRHLRPEFGFGRGLGHYDCIGFANADVVLKRVKGLRSRLEASRPYFLWVHFMDPHSPYKRREPYFSRFWGDRPVHRDLLGIGAAKEFSRRGLTPKSERSEFVKTLYDSEVRYTDDATRELLGMVPRSETAALIITADHGEEFNDHGNYGHGHNLLNETVKIPLIVRYSSPDHTLAGKTTTTSVSLVDVAPTLVELARGTPDANWSGRDLFRTAQGSERGERHLFSGLSRGRELRSVLERNFKYIYNLRKPTTSQLFDLDRDPGEHSNMAAGDPARSNDLKNLIIDRLISPDSAKHRPETSEISEEHLEQLRALGYVE